MVWKLQKFVAEKFLHLAQTLCDRIHHELSEAIVRIARSKLPNKIIDPSRR